MKMRKIGRILTVMFLTGGLMTGCQKKANRGFTGKRAKRRGNRNREQKQRNTGNFF